MTTITVYAKGLTVDVFDNVVTSPPPPPALPSWAPAPGQVADLTALAPLTAFSAQVKKPGFTGFYSANILKDQGNGVANPFYGDYGCYVAFGAGHAGSNDNSVMLLVLSQTGLAWQRATNPVDWTAAGIATPWDQIHTQTPNLVDTLWAEYRQSSGGATFTPPQPESGHLWDGADIIPPANGGGACGSLLTVIKQACSYDSWPSNTIVAHRLDFTDASGGPYNWARATAGTPPGVDANFPPGSCTALDTKRGRVWIAPGATANASYLRFYDIAAQTYGQVTTGTSKPTAAGVDSGSMTYDEPNDILIYTCGAKGIVHKFAYLSCANPAAGWTNVVFTGDAITPSATTNGGGPGSLGYCTDTGKWIFFVGRGDVANAYEITIPTPLGPTWGVVKRPMGSQTLPADIWITGSLRYLPAAKCFLFVTYQSAYSVMAYRPFGT